MSSYKVLIYSGHDPALEPYKAMIYSDWMRSLRYGNDWFKMIESSKFFEFYERAIHELLGKSSAIVRLAVLTEDPDTCLGWSLTEDDKLHYIFVKRDMRNQGIGSSLLPEHFTQVTHLTKIGQAIRREKFKDVIFNPF